VGVFEIPKQEPLSALTGGLVMTKIADPGNMGSLIRSCAAFGVKTVVTIDGADVWSPKVVQASAGTLALVNVFETNWKDLLRYKKDLKLCALVVDGGKKPSHTTLDNTLLVVGNEAQGIPQEWVAECEETMTISMPGQVESLNAAVAGSIALYLAFIDTVN
jgi:TrmH family RNA methyltransferase